MMWIRTAKCAPLLFTQLRHSYMSLFMYEQSFVLTDCIKNGPTIWTCTGSVCNRTGNVSACTGNVCNSSCHEMSVPTCYRQYLQLIGNVCNTIKCMQMYWKVCAWTSNVCNCTSNAVTVPAMPLTVQTMSVTVLAASVIVLTMSVPVLAMYVTLLVMQCLYVPTCCWQYLQLICNVCNYNQMFFFWPDLFFIEKVSADFNNSRITKDYLCKLYINTTIW
jgi:hypothetical protein